MQQNIFFQQNMYENAQCGRYKSEISLVEAEVCMAGFPLICLSISLQDIILICQGPGDLCEKSNPPLRYFQGRSPLWHPAVVWSYGKQ